MRPRQVVGQPATNPSSREHGRDTDSVRAGSGRWQLAEEDIAMGGMVE